MPRLEINFADPVEVQLNEDYVNSLAAADPIFGVYKESPNWWVIYQKAQGVVYDYTGTPRADGGVKTRRMTLSQAIEHFNGRIKKRGSYYGTATYGSSYYGS